MKISKLIIASCLVLVLTSFKTTGLSDEYDVEEFYKGLDPSSGTMVLTADDELEEAETILVPIKLDAGKYSVTISRKTTDLYKVDGKNIYIKTKYCYEYATGDEAILKVESSYGYTKGTIIF